MATIEDVRKCLAGNTSKDPRQRVNEIIALCEVEPVKANETVVHESSKKTTMRKRGNSD